jgi:hypothetical protein
MLDFSQIKLEKLILHNVGNKLREEKINYSSRFLNLDEPVKELLLKYFLSPFKSEALYNFHHSAELDRNEIYHYSNKVFDEPESLLNISKNIADRLYDESNHPKIKGGEFYLAYFTNCILNDEVVEAIGLFKSENKDTYLRVFEKNSNYEIDSEKGININKLDKGCLILNSEKEKGFILSIVDAVSGKGNEAQYWKDFLKIAPREDTFYHTQNYLNVYKDFCENAFKNEQEIDKREQLSLMNNAIKYFDEKENFNEQEFKTEVISKPELISSFQDYKQNWVEENDIKNIDSFDISQNAVKDRKKRIRSVLKLDKNFHVYIHGSQNMIERGFDEERQYHFYKLFFDKES